MLLGNIILVEDYYFTVHQRECIEKIQYAFFFINIIIEAIMRHTVPFFN